MAARDLTAGVGAGDAERAVAGPPSERLRDRGRRLALELVELLHGQRAAGLHLAEGQAEPLHRVGAVRRAHVGAGCRASGRSAGSVRKPAAASDCIASHHLGGVEGRLVGDGDRLAERLLGRLGAAGDAARLVSADCWNAASRTTLAPIRRYCRGGAPMAA